MAKYAAQSACECQAQLAAALDDAHRVTAGRAALRGAIERAPAHVLSAAGGRFDIAWNCPFCGRNVLRSFDEAGLRTLSA